MSHLGDAPGDHLMKAFHGLALAAACLAAVGIPGQQFGINLVLVWIVIAMAFWAAVRAGLDLQDSVLVFLAIVPVFLATIRSAGWLIGLQLVVAVGSMSVAVTRARGWISIIRAPFRVLTQLHRGLVLAVRPFFPARRWDSAALGPALRAGSLTLALVAVFGTLFLTADAAFASFAERLLVPDWNFALLPARVAVFVGSLALAGALAKLSPTLLETNVSPWVLPVQRPNLLQPVEWKVALTVLNVLFASFVVVQLTVLFGGHSHVLETSGLTYAEYARQGFFQLIVVAVLTLGVISATVALSGHEEERAWLRGLLGPLCLMTLVILLSAMKRMDLYQEAYGFTRMRLLVDLFIIWLGVVFIAIFAAGALWRGSWLPRALVVISLAACVGFGLANPDLRIAERNIDRFHVTGNIDLTYLSGLSTDALPALHELPDPMRACVIQPIVSRVAPSPSFWSFNLSRRAATGFVGETCKL